jgi:hypothetical protein
VTGELCDVGNAIVATLLPCVSQSLADARLDPPAIQAQFTGAGTPIADGCGGVIWSRVTSQYPTDGAGALFTQARVGHEIPAWVFVVELGVMWCHQNIDEAGNFIEPDAESSYGVRDGQYRMALYRAAGYLWPEAVKSSALAHVVDSRSVSPWTPIGPEGNISGGLLVMNVITNDLVVCCS